jgi:hypothetical protein
MQRLAFALLIYSFQRRGNIVRLGRQHLELCPLLWLLNDEFGPCGPDLIVPDITKACPMFFPWTAESARRATTGSGRAPVR